MYKTKKVTAIISAGGSGKRMGAPVPKQFLKIGGKTILETSVDRFCDVEFVDDVIVVVPESHVEYCRGIFDAGRYEASGIKVIPGGSERQDSVGRAIDSLSDLDSDDTVNIHDGVRPYVTKETIVNVIKAADEDGAAIAAVPTRDTIRHIDEGTLDRSKLYNVQTPQGFRYAIIKEAFDKAAKENFVGTDDGSLVERLGKPVTLVSGSDDNVKITTPGDLRNDMRVGTGFDVHVLTEGRKLILGGVEIPYKKGLLGHSDADVLIHALMDALLGAAALGDIGKLFPDNDPAYEGISSVKLLKKVISLLNDTGYTVGNADVTVICERPKLAGYIDQIRDDLAEAMGVSKESISVKATTTEKLGFTGRGEGIAAEAVVIINGSN